jgi:prepilin-type N-terminal cleavage/methylation domain-containing protein
LWGPSTTIIAGSFLKQPFGCETDVFAKERTVTPSNMNRRLFAKLAEDQGFTLIETLISLVVLTIGILGWVSFQGTTIRDRTMSREMTRALQVTQARVDALSAAAAQWDASAENVNGAASGATDTVDVDGGAYDLEWWITGFSPSFAQQRFWEVRVEARWGEGQGRLLELSRIVIGK